MSRFVCIMNKHSQKIRLFFYSFVKCEVTTVENAVFSHTYSPELNSFQSKACSFVNFTSCLHNKSSQLCHVILSLFSLTGYLKLKMGQQQMITVSKIPIHPYFVLFTSQYSISRTTSVCLQIIMKIKILFTHTIEN